MISVSRGTPRVTFFAETPHAIESVRSMTISLFLMIFYSEVAKVKQEATYEKYTGIMERVQCHLRRASWLTPHDFSTQELDP